MNTAQPLLVTISVAAEQLSAGIYDVSKLCEARTLPSVYIGKRRLIPAEALAAFVESIDGPSGVLRLNAADEVDISALPLGEACILRDELNDYIDSNTYVSRDALSIFDGVAEATGGVWTVERVASEVDVDLEHLTALDQRKITQFYGTQVLTGKASA